MSVQTTDAQVNDTAALSSIDECETVSVVIPCYNEERFIAKALEQLADQFEPDRYEIIIVDGLSDDNTRSVIDEFKLQRPALVVVVLDNPSRNIPTALNLGIGAAKGNIIARMDAHAIPCDGYIQRCVEVLSDDSVGVVGMPCRIQPGANTLLGRAIASAVGDPFGIGDAKYRLGTGTAARESVDTVAFACFRKSLWRELGGFNEGLLTNEDYDFNYRARLMRKQVILDRSGYCDYFARTSLSELAAQYRRYGGWKARMIRLHPRSLKLRHAIAPAFVLSLLVLALLGVFRPLALAIFGLEVGLYVSLALAFGWRIVRRDHTGLRMLLVMPIVYLTIHLNWGSCFLMGLVRQPR
jgi:glycosyltransferase involved in cell wall biosynthesis